MQAIIMGFLFIAGLWCGRNERFGIGNETVPAVCIEYVQHILHS